MRLHIDAAGAIRTDGQILSWREVADWARQKERERPDRVYLLEVDPKCKYSALVTGLDALRAAPVETISFRLSEPQ